MTRLRRALPILCLGLLLAGSRSAAAPQEDPAVDYTRVRWETHRAAQARARAELKPLLIHFSATWSDGCRRMQRETWTDRRVIRYLNDHFAMTTVDTDKLPAMARKYSVEGLPTLWFLDATGRRLTHLDGFASADNLLPLLEFIAAGDYAWTDYETWRGRRK